MLRKSSFEMNRIVSSENFFRIFSFASVLYIINPTPFIGFKKNPELYSFVYYCLAFGETMVVSASYLSIVEGEKRYHFVMFFLSKNV